jgi:hypothetical protein
LDDKAPSRSYAKVKSNINVAPEIILDTTSSKGESGSALYDDEGYAIGILSRCKDERSYYAAIDSEILTEAGLKGKGSFSLADD